MNDLRDFTMPPGEASRLLGIHPRSLTRRADMGCIPYMRTRAGRRRFRPDDVEYIAERQEWPPPGTYHEDGHAVQATGGGR